MSFFFLKFYTKNITLNTFPSGLNQDIKVPVHPTLQTVGLGDLHEF